MKILNLENENRKFTKSIENFHVMEYLQDSSVSPMTAMEEYYMSKMNVRRRQVVIELDKEHSAIIQSGAMQWMGGHVQATAGIKGIGDLFGKAIKGAKGICRKTGVRRRRISRAGTDLQIHHSCGCREMGLLRNDD